MNKHFTPGLIASLLFCNLLALTLAPGLNADVTGRRTRVDDSASCVGNQPDARVIGRHRTTRNAPNYAPFTDTATDTPKCEPLPRLQFTTAGAPA